MEHWRPRTLLREGNRKNKSDLWSQAVGFNLDLPHIFALLSLRKLPNFSKQSGYLAAFQRFLETIRYDNVCKV